MVQTVFVNAQVWQHRSGPPEAPTAVAVDEGRVVAVGLDAELLAADAAEVVDLAGQALLPSFGDGHAHPVFAGLLGEFADLRGAESVAEVVERVGTWAAEHPDAPWVRGDAYDPTISEAGVFEASALDAVVPDRPVWLRASDYHTAWVNSAALAAAGITRETPEPTDGTIVRDASGQPVGTLREWGAWQMVERVAPPVPLTVRVPALLRAARELASLGVTWVQDAWVVPGEEDVWVAAASTGDLAVRANLAFLAHPLDWREGIDDLPRRRREVEEGTAGTVMARTVKFFADGVIEAGTGALLEPYASCTHNGLPNWDWDELRAAVIAHDRLGFQVHIHAIGDAAVRAALDAIAAAEIENGARDRRPVIAHAQLVDPQDLGRFEALNVLAVMQPFWACADPLMVQLTAPRLGPERADRQYPIATLARAGVLSFGSDWPVSTADPMAGITVAVTRRRPGQGGESWIPEERVRVTEAVEAYTAGVARQAFEEHEWGRIEPGYRADFVVLSEDPRTVEPAKLADVRVTSTWLGGRRTA